MYNKLGSLEEYILLLVLIQKGNAYSVSLAEQYKDQMGKTISTPAIHTVLQQLEKKSLVKSKMTKPTSKRGGRSKRIYEITKKGYALISKIRSERKVLWKLAPRISF